MLETASQRAKNDVNRFESRLSDLEQKHDEVKGQCQSLHQGNTSHERQLKNLRDLIENGSRFERIEEKMTSLDAKYRSLSETVDGTEKAHENIKNQMAELSQGQREQGQKLRHLEEDKASLSHVENSARSIWDAVEVDRTRLGGLESSIKTLDHLQNNLQQLSGSHERLENRAGALDKRLSDAESGISSLSSHLSEKKDEFQGRCRNLQTELQQVQTTVDNLESRV